MAARRFSKASIEALAHAKMIGVRAGTAHKYTGVWVVVVEGRVFVRSWNDNRTGWFRAFLDEPAGSIQFADVERKVRATPTRSQRLRDAVSAAYGEKYDTRASQKWVRGFAQPKRAVNTLELTPR